MNPTCVFRAFARVCRVPRPSKHEERMVSFLLSFGQGLGLPTKRDEAGNVLISKPASPGMEGRPTVVLQSHMDMVCEKNADVQFDFLHDSIETYVDGDWLRAKGTTLGADDGIGVAMQMALLESTDIVHGPIECLFTVDEETGLTGAESLGSDFLSGRFLINLDSEDEGEIFVSCAGGCTTYASFAYEPTPASERLFFVRLSVSGLTGGHSGDDIEKKRANANKLLARFLYQQWRKRRIVLSDIQAGGLHNAIPREATATIGVPWAEKEQVRIDWNLFSADVEEEYRVTEPGMRLDMVSVEATAVIVDADTTRRLILALQAVDNGILSMSQDIDLVETSSNLASVRLNAETRTIDVVTSQRSSLASAKLNMANTVCAAFELAGAKVTSGEGYPGWTPRANSHLLAVAKEQYERLFGRQPHVRGIHAGLECGLFSEKYPGLDMISMGPTLRGVHSPDEKLFIPSVAKVWEHLLAILQHI